MKLECAHADTCLSSYWSGHHLPHIQIPVWPGMTLPQIKDALRSELWHDAIGGRSPPDELTEEWHDAARAAVDAIEPVDSEKTTFFDDVEVNDEMNGGDSVYAFFVFMEKED